MATTGCDPQYVWSQWSGTTSSTSMVDYLYSSAVWDSWSTTSYTYSGTSSGTSDNIWYTWHDGQEVYQQAVQQYYAIPPKMTAEQQQAIEAARVQSEAIRLEAQKRAFELQKKKEAAEEKAKQMLLDLIGEDLRAEYERTGQVYVQGQRHGYIIKGYGHIKRIEGNGKIRELCIHLQERYKYPDTDNVIALLMTLKHDEERFLKTANKHGLYDLSHYQDKELEAAGMPKDGLKTRIELHTPAPTLGEGIAA